MSPHEPRAFLACHLMSINPFKPPETDSTKNPLPPATPGSPLKAVLMGLAVDIGGSVLIGIAITVVYATQLHDKGLSDNDMREALGHMPHDTALYVVGTLLGLLMSLLGGYTCARIVRRDEYRSGLVMTACSALFGLAVGAHPNVDEMLLLMTITSVACNLLGVKFGAEHNRRAEAPGGPAEDASTP